MKRHAYLFFVLLSSSVFAQIPKSLDSLEVYLKTKSKDSTYVIAMKDCAFAYFNKSQYDKADSLAIAVKILGEKIGFPKGTYFSYLIKGAVANYKSDTQKSLEYFLKASEIAQKYLSKATISKSLGNVALAYGKLGDNNNTMKYALQSIEIQEKYLNPKNMAVGPYQLVGKILKQSEQYEKALKYYEKAGEVSKVINDGQGMAINENSLGNLYDSWGKQKEAMQHYEKGLELAEKINYKYLETDLLINLGNMSMFFNENTKAENYFKRCEKLCREFESDEGLRNACANLGGLYQEQKKYPLAEKYLREVYELDKKMGNPTHLKDSNEYLAKFYAEIKDFQKAYQFSTEASAWKDSVSKNETFEKTQELLAKYETEKKEQQIKLLNEEAKATNFQKNAYLIGGVLTVLLAVFVVFSLQNRNKLRRLEENQKLRNRISADLHDEIGSTLSSISILSEIVAHQQKKDEFKPEIMQQVSNDSREVIDKMDDIIWTINPENDAFYNLETRLKSFAIPLFESKDIDFKFNFSAELESIKIDMGKRRDIYLILKEAINNLVKYSECKNAKIEGFCKDKLLIMNVIDDGIGFDTNAESLRNGQKNMQNRAMKIGGDLVVKSEIGGGTKVMLKVSI